MILQKRKLIVMIGLAGLVILAVSATRLPGGQYRNLKVLPQDISEQKLDSIMHSYNYALGVDCEFCHAKKNNQLDPESDANSMKENARSMIRLTMDINQTWFRYDTLVHPAYLNTVACYTCHRGEEMPPDIKKLPQEKPAPKKPLFPFGGK